jgi:hypothetical protein
MQKLWRPAMGWMYMIICLADMLVFPVLWSLLQAMMHMPITQWNPLTLQGAGLFHIAMGAVLGISAFGRTQEKLAGTAANPSNTSTTPNFGGSTSGFNSPTSGASTFSSPSTGFGSATGSFGSAPATSSFGGGGFGSVPATTPTSGFGGGFGATSTSQAVSTNASGKKVVPQDDFPPL